MTIFKNFFAKPRSFSHYLGSIYPIGEVSAKKKIFDFWVDTLIATVGSQKQTDPMGYFDFAN